MDVIHPSTFFFTPFYEDGDAVYPVPTGFNHSCSMSAPAFSKSDQGRGVFVERRVIVYDLDGY
jgi:hypothetical protein